MSSSHLPTTATEGVDQYCGTIRFEISHFSATVQLFSAWIIEQKRRGGGAYVGCNPQTCRNADYETKIAKYTRSIAKPYQLSC
jgi:hypothetical protein